MKIRSSMIGEKGFSQRQKSLARKIAKELFTNGIGERADRLVLVTNDCPEDCPDRGRGMGGWCERAVVSLIEDELRKGNPYGQ